jgi:cytochrome c-type biogenesis protein CcsB
VEAYAAIAVAYHDGKVADFNKAVADYRQMLAPQFNKQLVKAGREKFFNHIEPFYKAMILYVGALLLALAAFLTLALSPGTSETFRRSAFWLIVLAWLVHTTGLLFRMLLEGRPPVTNLYSSAIFIGWGAVVLCMILEMIFRIGIGAIVSAVAGFATLIIAHNLALNGDTMEMLRAVLDTNFWLATHVVAVTIGYASTFVAGLLAITYVVLGLFTPNLGATLGKRGVAAMGGAGGAAGFVAAGPAGAAAAGVAVTKGLSRSIGQINLGQALTKMIYGIVCFATLFSFVGTVLGGIWADQSWGRFWGWDPKENGALIIVLWNALILHARWGGMVRERGLANMAIFGNIVTSWSWFGVNMLNIGLHSYGFMDSAFKWLMAFVGSQVLLIALGLIPQKYWMSFRSRTATAPSAIEVEPAPSAKPKPSPAGA